jgi:hypothetical protein
MPIDALLDALADVDTSTTPPTDGQALVFHAASGLWIPATLAISLALDGLTDVDTTTTPPTDGQVLEYHSATGLWIPASLPAPGATNLNGLSDVDLTTPPTGGQVLEYDNASSQWKAASLPAPGATNLDGLTDVDTTTTPPADGQTLKWNNAAGLWKPGPDVGGGMTKLASVTLAASAASISFTGIAQTYQDLVLVVTGRGDKAATFAEIRAKFNNDATASYDFQNNSVNNASLSAGASVAAAYAFCGYIPASTGIANASASAEIVLPNYADGTFHKNYFSRGGIRLGTTVSNMFATNIWGDWRNVAAVNRLDVFPDSGNFVTGTKAVLYARG